MLLRIWLLLITINVFALSVNVYLQKKVITKIDEKVNLLQEISQLEKDLENQKKFEEEKAKTFTGIASYYSVAGCVGCREDLLMANGKKFDENAMTLAMNDIPLATRVTVTNTLTGESMNAEVTDTGGFNELGRIADLSKGLKEAINCTDLCEVKIVVRD